MQTIKLQSQVGSDGMLRLEIPVALRNTAVELLVVFQPLPQPKPMPIELGWPANYFEQTYGSCADDPIERPPQGEFEERETLL